MGLCSVFGLASGSPLVPHHQVEEIFADRLFTGVLGGTKLHSAMGERTGQEEIFIAVDGLCVKERKTKEGEIIKWH